MSGTMCLLVVGALAAVTVPALLPRLVPSSTAAPRMALLGWQLGSLSVIASWVLAGVLLPGTVLTVVVVGGVSGRLAYSLVVLAWCGRRTRQSHAQAARIIGREDPTLGATVVDSDVPAVYCLAGRPATIVVTSGGALPAEQLRAALAHERAHLAGRHHLLLVLAGAIRRAFPGVALFELADRETARLVEVVADDTAAQRHGRRTVAEALMRLACARTPATALAAGGPGVLHRVERLLCAPVPVTVRQRTRWVGGLTLAVAGPLAGIALPVAMLAPYLQTCSLPGM